MYKFCNTIIAACVYCAIKNKTKGIKFNEKKFLESSMYSHKESYKYYKKYYDNINIVLYTTQTIYVNKFYNVSPKKNLDTLPFTTNIKQMDWNKNSDTFMKIALISNDSFEIRNDKIVII